MKNWNNSRTKAATDYFSPAYERSFNNIQNLYDVKKLTSMSDYILIASGNSRRQVSALADKLIQSVKENKFKTLGVEGKAEGEWVLVDLGDIIVHIMHPSSREYYQLEKLWSK